MSLKYVKDVDIRCSNTSLQMWNITVEYREGVCTVKIRNPKIKKKYKVDFVVIKENFPKEVDSDTTGLGKYLMYGVGGTYGRFSQSVVIAFNHK